MTSLEFALCLACLCLWRAILTTTLKTSLSVRQNSGFISANVGANVTLPCFYERESAAVFHWYKQTVGQKPKLISTFYKYDKSGTFIDELKNDPRFKSESKNGKNHLTITSLRISDSATYYCAGSYAGYELEFAEGITVSVKGSGLNIPISVHQSASETIQPGGSVTLNCTVQTGSCDGKHSVYWFKYSEESHPGLIYSHGGRNDQCERNSNTQTHTCFYNLPMKSLNLSHAETYYCAVASCGHILFGDGTKLDIKDEVDYSVLVYFLSAALALTLILVVLLALLVYKMSRKTCKCTECSVTFSATSAPNMSLCQDADSLHYAALRDHKSNRSRGQRDDTMPECVYSRVKQ